MTRREIPRDPSEVPEQVFNANKPTADLTPTSEAAAERIREGWAALQAGDVPRG